MNEDSDDDRCNCIECYTQPTRSFRIKEGKKEPAHVTKTEFQGIKRGFYLPKKTVDDAVPNKRKSEVLPIPPVPSTAPVETKSPTTHKIIATPVPEAVKIEKEIQPEIHHEEEKMDNVIKCTKCIENSDSIDTRNQGAFRVTCSDGCTLTMHRNCFEKALGSGKKRDLKSCVCPTDDCGCSVTVINHRIPGQDSEFILWLRCDVKESDRPKKEEKGKEGKKKDEKKEKDKYKKDRREEEEGRKEEGRRADDPLPPSTTPSTCAVEEKEIISLALPKTKEEEGKKNLVKPLPADLEARPIERKEDALMSKYAVKETNTKENKKKNKKEVRVLALPGLTVKGQRGKKEEEDPWSVNDSPSVSEEVEGQSSNGVGTRMENTEMRYEHGPYGFAMPEEVQPDMIPFANFGRNDEMAASSQFIQHTLPSTVKLSNTNLAEADYPLDYAPFSTQPMHDLNGRSSLSGFTESPFADEPPPIENPHDYPTLERDSIQARKELVNFFETHIPVLEENAALFDTSQIDLDQLKNMLENFIEFQFYGGEDEKKNMTATLHSIFGGEVDNVIIPFLVDLQCFKVGYVDGRLVVSVKTEGKERREREEQTRRENEEEERRKKHEEDKRREERDAEERRREERKKEEVRRAVMELEEKAKRKEEEREEAIRREEERLLRIREERREEEEKRAREKRRREEEERRELLVEQKRREEAEEKNRRALEEQRLRDEEERRKSWEKEEEENRKKRIEEERKKREKDEADLLAFENEKRRKEDEEGERSMEELMDEKLELDAMRKKDADKRTAERELERRTREAISSLRTRDQTKDSSSESSPERLQILKRVSGSASVAPLPLSSSSSSSFSTSAPPFVPRCTNTKAELNPNAPAFVPIQSAQDEPLLMDEHGKEVDKIWIEVNKQILEKNKNTIDELNRRVAELEEEKKKMAEKDALREMDMQRMNGTRADEEKKNHQTIAQLQSQMREKDEKIEWKEQTISQICLESEKKSEELNRIRRTYDSEMENMKTRYREATSIAIDERRAKERVTEMAERREQEVKKEKLERKTACAKEAVIQCTSIINRLAVDAEAEVMASLFVDLRKKWIDHHSILNQYLEALQRGEWMDVDVALSLKEPSMPREADELVKECYVWRYQTMHILSFRLATIVKKCLIDHKRHYEDVYIIGIIQKWMKIHKDPAKITASVTQVANMVAQAMGDAPLMPPKYVNVAVEVPPPPSASPSSRVVPLSPLQTPPPRKTSGIERAEPKGWKKASDKVRQVDMRDHECSICLEDTEGGDISYCETFSCNEPYHNECLDRYWKTGGRNCPRCRTPMPPRDAFPALG